VGETALVTPADKAAERQLGQGVNLRADALPLKDSLQRLARDTGANVVLDQRLTKEGQTAVTARLDDVPLETAVEVLADQAGLKAVRLNNVLYVTTEARAEKLHRPPAAAAPAGGWQVWPDGAGGFRLTPPAGFPGAGVFGVPGGALGVSGVGGLGGQIGLGGQGGLAGMGGVPPPMPPKPPVPPTPPKPAPPKPKAETPPAPAKPAVTPPPPNKKPEDKKPDPASGPRPSRPKSGRKPRAPGRSRMIRLAR
jgi:hypothetical protein